MQCFHCGAIYPDGMPNCGAPATPPVSQNGPGLGQQVFGQQPIRSDYQKKNFCIIRI